jgi:integration host factor subunit alpha
MTKANIVEKLHQQTGQAKKVCADQVEAVLGLIKDTLANGEQVKITGFGAFQVKQKNDRRGRNPQTGEAITIEARKVLTFKVSNVLKDAINK